MINTLKELQAKHYVAVVGGSDLKKITEQLTQKGNLINNISTPVNAKYCYSHIIGNRLRTLMKLIISIRVNLLVFG